MSKNHISHCQAQRIDRGRQDPLFPLKKRDIEKSLESKNTCNIATQLSQNLVQGHGDSTTDTIAKRKLETENLFPPVFQRQICLPAVQGAHVAKRLFVDAAEDHSENTPQLSFSSDGSLIIMNQRWLHVLKSL